MKLKYFYTFVFSLMALFCLFFTWLLPLSYGLDYKIFFLVSGMINLQFAQTYYFIARFDELKEWLIPKHIK